jgi:glutathione synthase
MLTPLCHRQIQKLNRSNSIQFLLPSADYLVLLQNYISIAPVYAINIRHLLSIGAYGSETPIARKNLPDNPAAEMLAAGLAQAHMAYSSPYSAVLLVVQEPERNAFDQRWIEYHLLEKYGIQTCRMTLKEIATSAKLDNQRRLVVPKITAERDKQEISVVYLRAGYGPNDYPTRTEWQARRLLELSKAIKCPTVITQLAGCKKVQQVLARPNILERYPYC